MTNGWRSSDLFWMRSAGFPVAWTQALALPATCDLGTGWNALLDADEALGHELTALVRAVQPPVGQRTLARLPAYGAAQLGAKLPADTPPAARTAILALAERRDAVRERLAPAEAELERAFAGEALEARRRLLEYFADPLVDEALFLSNREAWQRIRSLRERAPAALNARERQAVRLAWNFFQRICCKNDTTSFYGPIAWGRFGEDEAPLTLHQGETWLGARVVAIEYWLVQRFADALSADARVLPHVPLRLSPGCHLDGDVLAYPLGKRRALSPGLAAVVREIASGDSAVTTSGLVALARTSGEERLAERVEQLCAKGVLERRVLVPTVIAQPQHWLRRAIEGLALPAEVRTHWLHALARLDAIRGGYERGGVAERVEASLRCESLLAELGISSERESGKMYVGRYPFYEDCARTADVRFGRALRDELQTGLAPVLELYRHLTRAVAAELHGAYGAVYDGFAGAGGEVDFLSWYRASRELPQLGAIAARLRAAIAGAWDARLPAAPGAEEIAVAPELLHAVAERLAELALAPDDGPDVLGAAIHSPDVMLAAASVEAVARGEYRIVLGEVHPAVHTVAQPVAAPFCDARDVLEREVEALLAPGRMLLADPPGTYQRSNINWPRCATLYEVVMPGSASRLAPEQRVSSGACVVRRRGARLELVDRASGRTEDLVSAVPGDLHRLLFALAGDLIAPSHGARVRLGRVVLKRRKWTVDPATLPPVERPAESAAAFARLGRWGRSLGMPRHVFFKAPQETKPIFLDFENPLALDLFLKIARQSERLTISEMLPGPDELWLCDGRGAFTAEFRMTFFQPTASRAVLAGR